MAAQAPVTPASVKSGETGSQSVLGDAAMLTEDEVASSHCCTCHKSIDLSNSLVIVRLTAQVSRGEALQELPRIPSSHREVEEKPRQLGERLVERVHRQGDFLFPKLSPLEGR